MSDERQATNLDKLASELRQAGFPGARSWSEADRLLSATIKALNRLDNERPRGPLPRKGDDVMTITRDLVEAERAGR